jgi:hypothetical protein
MLDGPVLAAIPVVELLQQVDLTMLQLPMASLTMGSSRSFVSGILTPPALCKNNNTTGRRTGKEATKPNTTS